MYKAPLFCFIVSVFIIAIFPEDGNAHRSGCHRWHTCPSDSGSYDCGDLGYECRYSSIPSNSSSVAGGTMDAPSPSNSLNNPRAPSSSAELTASNKPSFGETLSEVLDNNFPTNLGAVCGQIVRGTVTLDRDLNCSQDGLIVGQDNTIINLNGHSISGPGESSSKVGIVVPQSNNVVIQGNGSIRNFQTGISITSSEGTKVSGNTIEGNKIGIFITSSKGTNVQSNFVLANTIGIGLHSSKWAQLHNNKVNNNGLSGATLVNTDNSKLEANSINGSENGIMIDAQSTINLVLNNALFNNSIDLNHADGLSPVVNYNELLNNQCSTSQPDGACNSVKPVTEVSQMQASVSNELSMLESLYKQGVITEQEFLRMKQSLVGQNTVDNREQEKEEESEESSTLPKPTTTEGIELSGLVTHVVDGDTLDINDVTVRLALVDTPEIGENGYESAKSFVENLCLGKQAQVDIDDGQRGGDRYGREIGIVYCDGTNVNKELIEKEYAIIYTDYCNVSEFATDVWSNCSSASSPIFTQNNTDDTEQVSRLSEDGNENCDSSYPTLCIPSSPDLDCADVSQKRFTVAGSDPHGFDRDGDGIGCES